METVEQWQRGVDDNLRADESAVGVLQRSVNRITAPKAFYTAVPGAFLTRSDPGPWNVWVNTGKNVKFTTATGSVIITVACGSYCIRTMSGLSYRVEHTGPNNDTIIDRAANLQTSAINDKRNPQTEFDNIFNVKHTIGLTLETGPIYTLTAWAYLGAPAATFGSEYIQLSELSLIVRESK